MSNNNFDVRLILGSKTDKDNANTVLKIWKQLEVTYGYSIASCHWHSGTAYNEFIHRIHERIIVFIGGMSLAAPAIIHATLKNSDIWDKLVWAIPTDEKALSAIQDLPMGTWILTTGLNTVSLSHSLKNNALAVAHLVGNMLTGREEILENLGKWHSDTRAGAKKLIASGSLVERLIA
jgi:phosphoribosylcarboxyaminoimidazole (NCAIR) mutase